VTDTAERLMVALEETTAMCRAATTWAPEDIQGLRYHALEAAKKGMAALMHARAASTGTPEEPR
jgi:hypothetical protein